jgi:hypothetical protein
MDHLYVCHWSNGHIKVGRSIDPVSRIAAHAERVACFGVTLVEHRTFRCAGNVITAEADLIQECNDNAAVRNLNEWFEGLEFSEVCSWAELVAARQYPEPSTSTRRQDGSVDFGAIIRALMAKGVTQTQMAAHCNCRQSAIGNILARPNADPCYSIGAALMALHESEA